jgi:hypothetical protein
MNIVKQHGFSASVLEDEITAIATRHTNHHRDTQQVFSA